MSLIFSLFYPFLLHFLIFFLSWPVADCVENIDAQRVFGYALFKDGKSTRLSYPLEKFHAEVSGRSFHNGRFIQRMREKAASLPKYVPFYHFFLIDIPPFLFSMISLACIILNMLCKVLHLQTISC